MNDERERRVAEARRLANEPLLIEAFERIEKQCTERLLRLPTWRAERERRALIDRINVIRGLRAELETIIAVGDQQARKKPSFA